ncbi:hypothetical protein O9H85_23205 [Paenibacillus filicis]|uniref:Uncharacterized protein n=1 Tax=Paenibacillus gyeongsangnamensis TaxID=3388067 RepID=A0ABT4QEG0_9BACL|nr:hypothetical protein [Paenibacillus filicis]MCZ8515268.1 hypothetical protein [Paenibacillus filicis]
MKRSYLGVILLCLVVLLNIICTQQVVNNFFYDRYERVLLFAGLNILLFPIALWIYKRERDSE